MIWISSQHERIKGVSVHNSLSAVPSTGTVTTLPRLPCTASLYCLAWPGFSFWMGMQGGHAGSHRESHRTMKAGWLSAYLLPLPCSSLTVLPCPSHSPFPIE